MDWSVRRFLMLAIMLVVCHAQDASIEQQFKAWMGHHDKTYSSVEAQARALENFKHSLTRIMDHAKAGRNDTHSFGLTNFADLSPSEFRAVHLLKNTQQRGDREYIKLKPQELPAKFDWRRRPQYVMTPVRDQGTCGAGWATAVVENVESMHARGNNTLLPLSVQQVISCAAEESDVGCGRGHPEFGFKYLAKAMGLELEINYPYQPQHGKPEPCHPQGVGSMVKISGFRYIEPNEDALQQAVYQIGPIVVCVDASGWQDYMLGVYHDECSAVANHCVLLVGWGETKHKTKYWVAKNSWSNQWGYKGYIHLRRGTDHCGVTREAMTSIPAWMKL